MASLVLALIAILSICGFPLRCRRRRRAAQDRGRLRGDECSGGAAVGRP